VANLKAMFEKKPAENPFPVKKANNTPAGKPAQPKEEKKVEQIEPQSVSSLKSVFGFEKKADTNTMGSGPTRTSVNVPPKETSGGGVNPFNKKPVEETKASTGAAFPWNKKPVEDKPQIPSANTTDKPANPWKKDPIVEAPKPTPAEVQPPKPVV
jgi:hypothetical protein